MELIKQTKLRIKYLQFIKDPTRTSLIFEIIELGSSLRANEASIAQLESTVLQNSDFKDAWEARWMPKTPSLNELEQMKRGSLGYAYRDHLKKNSLELQFYPTPLIHRPVDYLSYRLFHAHDLWHIVLGYDVSPQGELEVQAFSMAQIPSPASIMLIVGGLMNLLGSNPASLPKVFDALIHAYLRGKNSRFLLGISLENLLAEELDGVRSKLTA